MEWHCIGKTALALAIAAYAAGCSSTSAPRKNPSATTSTIEYPEATSYETPLLQMTIVEGSTKDAIQLLVKKKFENFEGLKQVTLQQYYAPAVGLEIGTEEMIRRDDGSITLLDFRTGVIALEAGAQTVMVQVQKKEMVFDKDGRPLAPRRYYVEEPREQLYVLVQNKVSGEKFKLLSEIVNLQ